MINFIGKPRCEAGLFFVYRLCGSGRSRPHFPAWRSAVVGKASKKSEMGAYFRRMKSKDGHMQAIVATAHKMARIIYTMVKNRKEYNPKLVGCNEKELLERKIARATKQLQKLNEKLENVA